ncbi:hypothetical protein C8R47DRAFT_1062793 [Mycena vitilis]|nr:hypothetical protein C8R47DRAFT_1062793 [Mycena vitilis]
MSSPPLTPNWPAEISSQKQLLDYLRDEHTPALHNSWYTVDFFSPRMQLGGDKTAYTDHEGNDAVVIAFGTVLRAVTAEEDGMKCTIRAALNANDDLKILFKEQSERLWDPVRSDGALDFDFNRVILTVFNVAVVDEEQDPQVEAWTSAIRFATSGGTVDVNVSKAEFFVPTQQQALQSSTPNEPKDFCMKVGDWILFQASMHLLDAASDKDCRVRLLDFDKPTTSIPAESFPLADDGSEPTTSQTMSSDSDEAAGGEDDPATGGLADTKGKGKRKASAEANGDRERHNPVRRSERKLVGEKKTENGMAAISNTHGRALRRLGGGNCGRPQAVDVIVYPVEYQFLDLVQRRCGEGRVNQSTKEQGRLLNAGQRGSATRMPLLPLYILPMFQPRTTTVDAEAIEQAILGQAVTFAGLVRGMVFATDAAHPVWATVPTNARPGISNVTDVVYQPWLSWGAPANLSEIDIERCTADVERLPGRNPLELKNGFCIFVAEQNGALQQPVNGQLSHLIDRADAWRGNVLVLRRTAGRHGFEDMEDTDAKKVVFIVKRTCKTRLFKVEGIQWHEWKRLNCRFQ